MFRHMATALPPLSRTVEGPPKNCSKCKTATASAGDAWCKDCRAKYQKEYRDSIEWRAERRGLIRGIQAMRESVVNYFRAYAGRPFLGNEVASVIGSLPGPEVASEDAAKTQ